MHVNGIGRIDKPLKPSSPPSRSADVLSLNEVCIALGVSDTLVEALADRRLLRIVTRTRWTRGIAWNDLHAFVQCRYAWPLLRTDEMGDLDLIAALHHARAAATADGWCWWSIADIETHTGVMGRTIRRWRAYGWPAPDAEWWLAPIVGEGWFVWMRGTPTAFDRAARSAATRSYVVQRWRQGATWPEIGAELGVSETTAYYHFRQAQRHGEVSDAA